MDNVKWDPGHNHNGQITKPQPVVANVDKTPTSRLAVSKEECKDELHLWAQMKAANTFLQC